MRSFTAFPSHNGDFIHDMSFDHYGTRLATCSSNQSVKLWSLFEEKWSLSHEWNVRSKYH